MPIENRIRTKPMLWNNTMTELNHLGAALIIKPEIFEGKMNQLFSAQNYYSGNPLSSIFWNTGAEKVITSNEWEWELKGIDERPLTIIEKVETATKPGFGKTTFRIKGDEDLYVPGDVISPGTSGQKYQSRVMTAPIKDGNGWIYTLRLVTDNYNDFVPVKFLESGQAWAKLFSTYGEGDTEDGSTHASSSLILKDKLGKFRKHYKVTDYVAEQVLAVKVPDSKGNFHDSWIRLTEVEYWQQWYRELERAFWYNRISHSINNAPGRMVDSFSGIYEKLEDSNIHYYSEFSAKLIEEFLLDIYYSRIKPGVKRKIKVFTGEYGMLIFSRAMQDLMQKRGWVLANSNFNPVQGMKSEYHTNAYSIGYQFLAYKMHNGVELEVVHNPIQDDRTINFEIDPITGYPVESMKFNFLDFSGEGSESNIRLVSKKDGYKFGYVAGLVNPYGANKGTLMSHSGEYYSMHVSKECGIHIEDVTRCGQLILKRNS